MTDKVSFYSEGSRIAGLLYRPERTTGRVPGIVVCCGFGGLQDSQPPAICKLLASLGYMALSLDYRGFGESEGARGRVNPWAQTTDIKNAISYLQTIDEVDPERIGLYGTSFGGGNVVYVAATDKRAKCTVATVPVANGERWLKSLRSYWQWLDLMKRVERDRLQRVLTGQSEMVGRFELMVPDPDTKAYYEKRFEQTHVQSPPLALETIDYVLSFKPEDYVDLIAPRPVMFIHSEDDHLVSHDESISLYRRAGEPKRLELISKAGHYDVYTAEAFGQVMAFTQEWFSRFLMPERSGG